ncbi:hypothetical protein BT69DRAFT_1320193 [Atractiella rhizophila]|nr:hypothetical protein BT69DRAFT_1320193 [Atractiella rhizophila]
MDNAPDQQRLTTLPPLRSIAGVGTLLTNEPTQDSSSQPSLDPNLNPLPTRPTLERIASLGLTPNELRNRDSGLADCHILPAMHRKRGRPKLHDSGGSSKQKSKTATNPNNNNSASSSAANARTQAHRSNIPNGPHTVIISLSQRIARISPEGAAALGYAPQQMHEKLLGDFVQEPDVQKLSHLYTFLRNLHENIEFGGPVPCSLEDMFSYDLTQLACMVPDTLAPAETIRFRVKNALTDTFKVTMWLGGFFGATLKDPESMKRAYFVASLSATSVEQQTYSKPPPPALVPSNAQFSPSGMSGPSNYANSHASPVSTNYAFQQHPQPPPNPQQTLRYLTPQAYPSFTPLMPNENGINAAVQTSAQPQEYTTLASHPQHPHPGQEFIRRQSLPVLPTHPHTAQGGGQMFASPGQAMNSIPDGAGLEMAMRRNSLEERPTGEFEAFQQTQHQYPLGVGVAVQAYPHPHLTNAGAVMPQGHAGRNGPTQTNPMPPYS